MVVPSRTSSGGTGGGGLTGLACGSAAACCLRVLERLMEVFNHFAFTFIAVYGFNFADAGKATWQLFRQVGLLGLGNHCMIQFICFMGCFGGGALSALVALIFVEATELKDVVPLWSSAGLGTYARPWKRRRLPVILSQACSRPSFRRQDSIRGLQDLWWPGRRF